MGEENLAPVTTWDTGSEVYCLAISSNGGRIVAGMKGGVIRAWDVKTGVVVIEKFEGHTGDVRSVAFSPGDAHIVSGSNDHTIIIWDAHTGALVAGPLKGHTAIVWSAVFSPDNTLLCSTSTDRTICIWKLSTLSQVKQLVGHKGIIGSAAFSSNGDRIITGSDDGTVCIWDVHAGTLIGEPLNRHSAGVWSVAFSPDNTRIVSGCRDGTICIWDTHSRDLVAGPLAGHTELVRSIRFLPNSKYFATGSWDRTIRIWDVRDGTQIGAPLQGHTKPVTSVLFSPDGASIISGAWDGTIRIWNTPQAIYLLVFSKMSAQEMFNTLLRYGCTDLTSFMDPRRYSSSAIATGGFGDVWRGVLMDGTVVAVKCLRLHLLLEGDGKGMKRAMREIYHWSKASHVNVQKLAGIIMFQGQMGMVSEWMEGGNLQQYIRNHPNVERYQLCVQVATGVAYLHSIGMVHGDIKTLNILVSGEGVAKINDFDYSVLSDTTLRFSETTKVGGGTLRWMAPELFQNQGEEDTSPPVARNKQTDVYALGMTMLEIISGRVPYVEYNMDMAVYRAIDRRQVPRRPKELLPEQDLRAERMWKLLLECWNHDPVARPEASSVLQSLQTFAV